MTTDLGGGGVAEGPVVFVAAWKGGSGAAESALDRMRAVWIGDCRHHVVMADTKKWRCHVEELAAAADDAVAPAAIARNVEEQGVEGTEVARAFRVIAFVFAAATVMAAAATTVPLSLYPMAERPVLALDTRLPPPPLMRGG